MDNNKKCKHGKVYTCKRIPMLNYLRRRGFIPFDTIAEIKNPKYLNWQFHNSPQLEDAIDEYFDQLHKGIKRPQ